MSIRKTLLLIAAALICIPAATIALSSDAEAKSFRSSSSSSRSYSRSYYKPKPKTTYKAPAKKVEVKKNTTVIQNNTINQGSSGGGILSTMAGTAGGVVAGNAISDWLRDDEPVQTPEVPVESIKERLPEATNTVCPVGYACDFTNGKIYKLPTE